jgi:hypothetical protein
MSNWSWTGFAHGLAAGTADVAKMGVRYALDSQLLEEKYGLEQKAEEHRLRLRQTIGDEERAKQVREVDEAAGPYEQQQIVGKANKAYDFTDPETGEASPIKNLDEIDDADKAAVLADPDVALSRREKLDAALMGMFRTGRMDSRELAYLAAQDEKTQTDWFFKMKNLEEKELNREQKAYDEAANRDLKASLANSSKGIERALLLQANAQSHSDRSRDIMAAQHDVNFLREKLLTDKTLVGDRKTAHEKKLSEAESFLQSLKGQRPSGVGASAPQGVSAAPTTRKYDPETGIIK